MGIRTVDLGLPENFERLDYLVGKIAGKNVVWLKGMNVVRLAISWDRQELGDRYSPTTDAQQCLEATPRCSIIYSYKIIDISDSERKFIDKYKAAIFSVKAVKGNVEYIYGSSELIARCLALVYSVYGDEVPESEFTEQENAN